MNEPKFKRGDIVKYEREPGWFLFFEVDITDVVAKKRYYTFTSEESYWEDDLTLVCYSVNREDNS